MSERPSLSVWTIYQRPADHPLVPFVVRRFVVTAAGSAPTSDVLFASTLDQARSLLPAGLYPMGRNPRDAPVIVESWV